ncbi:MAG: MarR family winged helix-turn-helix transcriptional regulator [Sulfobacillus sp.]
MMNENPMVDVPITLQDALGSQYGDLSRPQFRLMMKLCNSNPTVSELAESLNISSPGVTQMVDKLASRGYITRYTPDRDQRVVRISISDRGREVLHVAVTQFEERVMAMMQTFSVREKEVLTELLQRMTQPFFSRRKKMTP